ncbi:hypothetical protein D9M71_544390 [compost metagenome]
MLGGDGGERRGAADKGTGQERLNDFILDLVALFLIDLAHLFGFDLFDLFLDRIAHDAARQDAFFLARCNQQEVLADMYQRRVFAFAERGDETVGGQLLACAWARRFGGQCGFQGLGIKRDILGQAIDKQVFEPHGVTLSLHLRRALFSEPVPEANPALSVWNA